MSSVFFDANDLQNAEDDKLNKIVLQYNTIGFELPYGVNSLRLIERLRLLEILEDEKATAQEKMDFAFDITMQMLVGKECNIIWTDADGKKHKIYSFTIKSRYQELSDFPVFFQYPCLFKWLVSFITGSELKKYPLSLESLLGLTREKEEPLTHQSKKLKKSKVHTQE